MDPRQPQQHPFSRNTASPYGRTPFPPSANQPPFPPSSHPPSATPSYTEHQRRPSEPPYYTPQRSYPPDGPPMGGSGHSRHQSASSIGARGMPPPSSPQQTQHHGYGPPPPPRGPSVSVGPPSAFSSGRDLPSLPPINAQPQASSSMRPQSTGMSISSMLGGPPPATREPATTQYGSPIVTSAGGPVFPGTTHASPRMGAGSDYAPFRRPQTPEHRPYEPRDNRANSAGSPPGVGSYPTPEARRFGTPSRPGMPPAEERREPIRVPNPNAMPPRPSSQPSAYGGPQHAPSRRPVANPPYQESVFGRRPMDERQFQEGRPVERERIPEDRQMEQEIQRQRQMDSEARHRELGRPVERVSASELRRREREEKYPWSKQAEGRERELLEQRFGRPPGSYEERQTGYGYAAGDLQTELLKREREKEREREIAMQREQELRERELQERERERERAMAERNSLHREYAHQQRNPQDPYNRPPEPREQPAWMRPGPEPSRPAYEPPERPPPQAQSSNGYEYPTTTAPQYRDHPAYAPNEPRYAPSSQPASIPPQHSAPTAFEAYIEQEQRAAQLHQQQQQQQQTTFQPTLNGPYQSQESPRRRDLEDPQQLQQQQRLLGVQEINRRGRVSPLPQAVQGAQGQIGGPGGEPGIKSEFGRMFSGIGSGVGAMGAPSPVSAGQPLPFSGQLRREDVENLPGQDSPMENGKMARSSSRGGGNPRRRKLKEEESRGDDESSTGRRTPSGRGKRAKTHHHHHHHHHTQRPDPQDNTSSPSLAQTPFKSTAGKTIPSPPDPTAALHHHHIPASRIHHHHASLNHNPKPPPSPKPTIPLPIRHISSTAVLQSVASLPRSHLGHAYYTSTLSPSSKPTRNGDPSRGFASTPKPLPRFEGRENCTFTVKIPPLILEEACRRDITYRRALWGTDVYTDDSDVLAAAIHSGWVQGAFAEDIGELGLSILLGDTCSLPPIDTEITEKPETGPSIVPEGKELHVTILILPTLEKYASSIRYGVKSREWGGRKEGGHDGLSFMIMSVKWISGLSSIPSKQPFSSQLTQGELDEEESFARLFNGGPVGGESTDIGFSNVRAEGRSGNGFKGIGTQSWWRKEQGKGKEKRKERSVELLAEAAARLPAMEIIAGPNAGDKAGVVERVVERMRENANAVDGMADGGVRESVEVKREGEESQVV